MVLDRISAVTSDQISKVSEQLAQSAWGKPGLTDTQSLVPSPAPAQDTRSSSLSMDATALYPPIEMPAASSYSVTAKPWTETPTMFPGMTKETPQLAVPDISDQYGHRNAYSTAEDQYYEHRQAQIAPQQYGHRHAYSTTESEYYSHHSADNTARPVGNPNEHVQQIPHPNWGTTQHGRSHSANDQLHHETAHHGAHHHQHHETAHALHKHASAVHPQKGTHHQSEVDQMNRSLGRVMEDLGAAVNHGEQAVRQAFHGLIHGTVKGIASSVSSAEAFVNHGLDDLLKI